MLMEMAIARMGVRSASVKLYAGSVITSLAISLAMVAITDALGFELNAALPAAFGAIGAALFAAGTRIHSETSEQE